MPELDVELVEVEEPAHYVTFDLNATGKILFNFAVVVYGWSMRNVSATTEATLDVYDGTDTTGNVIFPVNLAGNETNREWFNRGVRLESGLYVNVTAQEVKGSVFYRRHRGH